MSIFRGEDKTNLWTI